MQQQSVIIVGGGIAGLIAAKHLCSRHRHVLLLEAREQLGGRINTIFPDKLHGLYMEGGAEFIHGKLPITCRLLHQYDIPFYKVEGKMVNISRQQSGIHEGSSWEKLLRKMALLKKDIPISALLDIHFPGKKNGLFRNAIKQFASGFDLADPQFASSKALYREWSEESDDQFRIEGGYKKIIDALHADCARAGCEFHTSVIVEKIAWSKNSVVAFTEKGKTYSAEKILITVPAGAFQDETKRGFIQFQPTIEEKINYFKFIGFGSVIKVFLFFSSAFWETRYKNAGFFFTDQSIPTWWTQEPKKNNLLIGWLGGTPASKWNSHTDEEILEAALVSLSISFDLPKVQLKKILIYSKIINWNKEAFIHGGYSFSLTNSRNAKKQLLRPIEDTIYFAGEALYEGRMQGTVEAALETGIKSAEKMR